MKYIVIFCCIGLVGCFMMYSSVPSYKINEPYLLNSAKGREIVFIPYVSGDIDTSFSMDRFIRAIMDRLSTRVDAKYIYWENFEMANCTLSYIDSIATTAGYVADKYFVNPPEKTTHELQQVSRECMRKYLGHDSGIAITFSGIKLETIYSNPWHELFEKPKYTLSGYYMIWDYQMDQYYGIGKLGERSAYSEKPIAKEIADILMISYGYFFDSPTAERPMYQVEKRKRSYDSLLIEEK